MKTNYRISGLFIYPVKSLGGINITASEVTDRGLKYDRRWMLVDEDNLFLTQRKNHQMALIGYKIDGGCLEFFHKPTGDSIKIGLEETLEENLDVIVWNDKVHSKRVSLLADKWFSKHLEIKCKLVFMPDDSVRPVDTRFAKNNEITSLSDGYPFLIIGQASLDDLNSRLEQKLFMDRFRPNIVFTGETPFEEEKMSSFVVGNIKFYGVKPCARCVITTINPETAAKSEEPLRTLSYYRMKNNKVLFGMNLLHEGNGVLTVGDEIKNIERK